MNNMKKGLRCMVIRFKDRPAQKEFTGKIFIGIRCKQPDLGALVKTEAGK
jgi:hypothetical protein